MENGLRQRERGEKEGREEKDLIQKKKRILRRSWGRGRARREISAITPSQRREGGSKAQTRSVGRSPESSAADYAGMTSHFSLHESIEADQLDVYV